MQTDQYYENAKKDLREKMEFHFAKAEAYEAALTALDVALTNATGSAHAIVETDGSVVLFDGRQSVPVHPAARQNIPTPYAPPTPAEPGKRRTPMAPRILADLILSWAWTQGKDFTAKTASHQFGYKQSSSSSVHRAIDVLLDAEAIANLTPNYSKNRVFRAVREKI